MLVYPKLPPTNWSMKYTLPFIGKKPSIPPLGPAEDGDLMDRTVSAGFNMVCVGGTPG